MNIALYGPGRAGGALALAAVAAGHRIVSIDGRSQSSVDALRSLVVVEPGQPDLLVVAVSDDAIESASAHLAGAVSASAAVHLSGAVPVEALAPLERSGAAIGSLHPLQTLPSAEVGAVKLAGAHVAITADDPLAGVLEAFVRSLGCIPFRIDDAHKPLYHAAAAAAANFTLASLGLAHELFDAAGVDPVVSRPLVAAIVDNAYELGPRDALTGPIARGDVETVRAQLAAIRRDAPESADQYVAMARATASFTGKSDEFLQVLS